MPYATWLFIFVIFPTALLWIFAHKTLRKYRRTFIYCTVLSLVFGVTWDYFVVANDIWFWPENCCMLPRLWGLPLDEVPFIAFSAIYITSLTLVLREVFHSRLKNKGSDQ